METQHLTYYNTMQIPSGDGEEMVIPYLSLKAISTPQAEFSSCSEKKDSYHSRLHLSW